MRPPNARSEISIAIGTLAPIFVGAALVGVRGEIDNTNVALILAVVVVAAGALGGRTAGLAAGLSAAASFDFFHTRPYLSLMIHDANDIEMTLLMIILGLVPGQLARNVVVVARQRDGGRGGLDQIRRLADLVARGREPAEVIATARAELIELFRLADCQFEAAPFHDRLYLQTLARNGVVEDSRYRMHPDGDLEVELPSEGIGLPVLSRGQIVGRFVLEVGPSAGATLEQRITAIALADQVGASLASFPPAQPLGTTR